MSTEAAERTNLLGLPRAEGRAAELPDELAQLLARQTEQVGAFRGLGAHARLVRPQPRGNSSVVLKK